MFRLGVDAVSHRKPHRERGKEYLDVKNPIA
jgi:hypothetical protein